MRVLKNFKGKTDLTLTMKCCSGRGRWCAFVQQTFVFNVGVFL